MAGRPDWGLPGRGAAGRYLWLWVAQAQGFSLRLYQLLPCPRGRAAVQAVACPGRAGAGNGVWAGAGRARWLEWHLRGGDGKQPVLRGRLSDEGLPSTRGFGSKRQR